MAEPIENSSSASVDADMELLNSPDLDSNDGGEDTNVKDPIEPNEDESLDDDEVIDDDSEDNDDDETEDSETEDDLDDNSNSDKNKIDPNSKIDLKKLKEKYPKLLKEFPELRPVLYREKQYSEVFATPELAKEGAQDLNSFSNMQKSIFEGDGKEFVSALKNAGMLEKFAGDISPTIYAMDKDIHYNKIIAPVIQNFFRTAYQAATRSQNKNLSNALAWSMDWMFGNGGLGQTIDPSMIDILEGKLSVVKPDSKSSKKLNSDGTEELSPEARELNNIKLERIGEFRGSVTSEMETGFKNEIQKNLGKYGLSKLEQRAITSDILNEVYSQLQKDTEHQANMAQLWSKASKNGFKSSDKSSINAAILARGQKLIPSIRRDLVAKAQGTDPKILAKRREKVEEINSRREPGNSGSAPKNFAGKTPTDPKKIDWSKTSDMDFLSGKVSLK